MYMVYTRMYNMINVYTWYIHVCTYWGIVYTILYTVQSIQIHVNTDFTWITTGFRGKHRDKEQRAFTAPSPAEADQDQGSPCPEDGDFFDGRPNAEETEEAISKFMSGLEGQEASCFESLHTLLGKLPVPAATHGSKMSHAAALEGGFIPKMDKEQEKRFTPSELLLYKHAVEYRYLISICTLD